MNPTSLTHASLQRGADARKEARSDIQAVGQPALLFLASIVALQGGDTYQINPLDDTGESVKDIADSEIDLLIDGVRAVPAIDLSVDEVVWCVQWPGHAKPLIFGASGGDGHGCNYGILAD